MSYQTSLGSFLTTIFVGDILCVYPIHSLIYGQIINSIHKWFNFGDNAACEIGKDVFERTEGEITAVQVSNIP